MISTISATIQHWSRQPIWAACLLVLITAISVGGPAACVMHCLLLEVAHREPHLPLMSHQHHGADDGADCPSSVQHTQHSEHAEPSALTIAIVLPLVLLPQLLVASFRPLAGDLRGISIALPPPRRPPRLAHS